MEDNNMKKIVETANPEVVEALVELAKDGSSDNMNKLCNLLSKSQIIVPIEVKTIDGIEGCVPAILVSDDNRFYQPVYTDVNHAKVGPGVDKISVSDFTRIVELIVMQNNAVKDESKIAGIVINPGVENITLTTDILTKIEL